MQPDRPEGQPNIGQTSTNQTTTRWASRTDDLVFVLFSFWILIGLCLDGWAHRNRPELETFFTPWHGVFYTGAIASTIWLAAIVMKGRADVATFRAAIPCGYGPALIGVAVFAFGGVGDAVWHTVFGVETGLDALLSPTHLIMLVGTLAGATAPLRAGWHNPALPRSPGPLTPGSMFLAPLLATAIAAAAVAYFFQYGNGFSNWPMALPVVAGQESEIPAALGLLATVTSTLILLGPMMLLLRRWDPPAGSFTVLFAVVGLFLAGLDGFEHWWQIIAPVVGGLVADAAIVADRNLGSGRPRSAALLCGGLVPVAMWSLSTLTTHWAWGVRWPAELWTGNIVMATLAGLALALISFPPPVPGDIGG